MPVIVEAGANPQLERNVFAGVDPDAFGALAADEAASATRENWFPAAHPVRPAGRGTTRPTR
jgi:hypothetical protein